MDGSTSSKANIESKKDGKPANLHINSENVIEAIRQVEKDFYQTKFRESKQFLIISCFAQIILFSVVAIIIIFVFGLQNNSRIFCDFKIKTVPMIIFQCFYFVNLSILIIKCWKIRKFKDIFFIKSELYTITTVAFICEIADFTSKQFDKNTESLWIWLVMIYMLFLISFVFPIYKSYQTTNKIKSNNSKNNNGEDIENQKSDNQGQLNTYQFFQSVINDNDKVSYWIEFAQNNYSVENIMFYRSVQEYERKKCAPCKKLLSQSIIKNYIKTSSPLIINISSNVRDSVLKNFEENPTKKDLFQSAKDEIVTLMYTNSFPFFYNSRYHHKMLIDGNYEDPTNYLQYSENSNSDQELKLLSKSINHNIFDLNKLENSSFKKDSSKATNEMNSKNSQKKQKNISNSKEGTSTNSGSDSGNVSGSGSSSGSSSGSG
ncbi:regulator of g protein signaling [Anaeramoeba flamelloides]|uniref:Regulator of g protein signaling n=1 Tax=Anaeramoeba flamelloides TaxID=1746091 RepID=A0ABQ8YGV3_9EUKA|nr:regulator of g protein signaling [Anaeramoeba flamelloides]